MKINADTEAADKAILDALTHGIGVLTIRFTSGKLFYDHVPIDQFMQLTEELQFISAQQPELKQ